MLVFIKTSRKVGRAVFFSLSFSSLSDTDHKTIKKAPAKREDVIQGVKSLVVGADKVEGSRGEA